MIILPVSTRKLVTIKENAGHIPALDGVFLTDIDWLTLILLILINGVVDCSLVAYFAGRRSKKALVEWLMSGDEEQQKAIGQIIALSIVTPIKTGRKVKDEDGKDHDEVLPLFKFLGRELSNSFLYKIKASRGGQMGGAGKDLSDDLGMSPSLLGSFGPRKGQTSAEWAMEQMLPRIMPMLEKKVGEILERKGGGF